jgi:hypothetical protein
MSTILILQCFLLFYLCIKTKLWCKKDEKLPTTFNLPMLNNTAISYEAATKSFNNGSSPVAAMQAHTITYVKGG